MPQAERVILEAEDEVTPVVNKANAGLDSFEKKAESSHGKVIRITDQTRSSIQRLITSLEKQVQDLRGTNEEMSNIFISLYDYAISKGLLQREPEFGQQLQSTTERFLALAKSTANDEENHDEQG